MCFCNNNNQQNINNFGFGIPRNGGYNGFNCGYNPFRHNSISYVSQRGPQGPVGPQGPSGLNDSVYAEVATATVASGTIIPVFLSESTTPTSSTVTSGSINVEQGVYLITYGFSGVPTSATDGISISLYANGVALPNGEITQVGAEVSASKTILYNASSSTTFSLYNTTGTTEILDDPYISVTKLQ